MEKSDLNISAKTIENILTLRYDPLQTPILPRLNWKDFKHIASPSIDKVKQIINYSILRNFEKSKPKSLTVALSSGIDSTLVLALLKNTLPETKINAISVKFSHSFDETKQAKKIAEYFDIDHKTIVVDNYLKKLPAAISIVGLPFWDLHWYYVVREASKQSKYLVSGDGGDELFGGYTFRYSKFLNLISSNSSSLDRVKAYIKCHERDSVPDQGKLFGKQIDFNWNSIHKELLPYFKNPLEPLDQVFLADYNGKLLYNFSILNFRLHKYFEIQYISPILSSDMITYSAQIKNSEKYNSQKRIGKIPLLKLLSALGISHLVAKKKHGFSVDTEELWTSYGYEICNNFLIDGRIISDGWINREWIKKHLKKDNHDVRYINKFFGLLAFEIWYRLFITKEMKSTSIVS